MNMVSCCSVIFPAITKTSLVLLYFLFVSEKLCFCTFLFFLFIFTVLLVQVLNLKAPEFAGSYMGKACL